MRVHVTRVRADCLPKLGDTAIRQALLAKGDTQVAVCPGMARFSFDCFFKLPDGLVNATLAQEQYPQAVVSLDAAGSQRDRPMIHVGGLPRLSVVREVISQMPISEIVAFRHCDGMLEERLAVLPKGDLPPR